MPQPSVVEDLFLKALAKSDAQEQVAFLDSACQGHAELRREVEQLLAAHPKAAGFLDPVAEKTAVYLPSGEQVGQLVAGRYKLLEQIGEGGMGTVWVVEQTQPVRRKVALKLIRIGMDSKTVVARFEAERQALAVMDHPNIAKVLDGGVTEQGRPFFVMEYVKGIPLTNYCDNARLNIADRLALFVQVCQAIQHAHQKGVIHRDLKPSNVLVCLYDGKPVPKVIDFGLAKAIHQPLTEHTLHTAHGVMMGTPLYMSPEQAEFNNLDVDTRSDIYALGVILYELLTGTTPLEKQRFQQAAWQEMLRLIKEEEPPRPSIRLSGSTTLPTLAAQRQLEPIKLSRTLRGELDWIVMKALEKDRSRRYETANGFAADVQRYLAGEPVQAHPPSAAYRLTKFIRRHKGRVVASSAFLLLLIASSAVSTYLAIKAHHAETVAESKRQEAEEASKLADRRLGEVFGATAVANEFRIEAETAALNARVDLDLKEVESDDRSGLLQLCAARTVLAEKRNAFEELRIMSPKEWFRNPLDNLDSFLAAAILTLGQERTSATLHRPMTHDGSAILWNELTRDQSTLLTFGGDRTARLWKAGTAEPIGILRQGNEAVLNCGFSPDGKTAYTDDADGVLRFWDVPSGRFRAALPMQANRYATLSPGELPQNKSGQQSAVLVDNTRAVTRGITYEKSADESTVHSVRFVGPVELWDTSNARLICRFDSPTRDNGSFEFTNHGRWITCVDAALGIVILSAEDGSPITTLNHPAPTSEFERLQNGYFAISPDERWIAYRLYAEDVIRIQDTSDWSKAPFILHPPKPKSHYVLSFIADNFVVLGEQGFVTIDAYTTYRIGRADQGSSKNVTTTESDSERDKETSVDPSTPVPINGDRRWSGQIVDGHYVNYNGDVYNSTTHRRLMPPAGRKYPSELARFAIDGRFVVLNANFDCTLIDTLTEKNIPLPRGSDACFMVPHLGLTSFRSDPKFIVLNNDRLAQIPRDLLSLWASICVRGELDAEGRFLPWDETKWESKRVELARAPAPIPGFPFPGHVASDRLYWLKAEFDVSNDKTSLARKLLERAETLGDPNEANRWREWLKANSTVKAQTD